MKSKKILTILVALLLNLNAFSQTQIHIGSKEDFLKIGTDSNYPINGNYLQTADIDLGDLGTRESAIIDTLSGEYDGGGFEISYSVEFNGTIVGGNYGLFGFVSGTIKNLYITSTNATLNGTAGNMNIGLMCGFLSSNGCITDCHVINGDINSSVQADNGGGSDAGLFVGQCIGKIQYSSATGNVVGVGYAGGLVGQLNDVWGSYWEDGYNGTILGCSFVGSVTAIGPPDCTFSNNAGNFAGGICGMVGDGTANNEISLCYANVIANGGIDSNNNNYAYGLAFFASSVNGTTITPTSANNYVKGEVNGNSIDSQEEIRNGTHSDHYENTNNNNDTVNSTLNDSIANVEFASDKIYFSRETGEIILIFGNRISNNTCEPPTGLSLTIGDVVSSQGNRYVSFDWDDAEGVIWDFTLFKGDEIIYSGTISFSGKSFYMQIQQNVDYTFAIHTNCSDDSHSYNVFETFKNPMPPCNTVININAENITSNSATISWNTGNGTNETGRTYEVFVICNDNSTTYTVNTNSINLTNLDTNTLYKVAVREVCSADNLSLAEIIEFKTLNETTNGYYYTVANGNFNNNTIWNTNTVPTGTDNIPIKIRHTVILTHNLYLTGSTTLNIEDKGILIIDQQGQLINKTTNDVEGIVEVKTPIKYMNQWTFIGAPFVDKDNNKQYKLETLKPSTGCDIVITGYDFNTGDWGADNQTPSYLRVNDYVGTGDGYMGFPFYDGIVTFTTYGDLWNYTTGSLNSYDNTTPKYKLNNNDVTLTKTVCPNSNSGHYLPLSNPYPAKLSVSKFLADNTAVQGLCVYRLNNNTREWQTLFDGATEAKGEILITEGFFVNFSTSGEKTITFKKEHMTNYSTTSAKSAVEREFIELALVQNNHASKLYFAHNEQAEQGYDIFDADKLFAMTEMTEPYFVTEGISLVKEEVAELPYYATMNVRSFEHDSVSFVANNIPEGYSVSIIDGEETIELTENSAYSTLVSRGENANRFKLLIKKSVGLGEVEELDVEITNSNRLVNVSSTEEDLQIEVYNALGQKVFATKERNFTLNNVSAGAYVVKAFNNTASKTQKIVIK